MTARVLLAAALLLAGCQVAIAQIEACAKACASTGKAMALCTHEQCVCGDAPDAGAAK